MFGKFTLVRFLAHAKHIVAGECNYTSSAPRHTRKLSPPVVYIEWRRETWRGISKRIAVLFQTSACCKLNTDNKWQYNSVLFPGQDSILWHCLFSPRCMNWYLQISRDTSRLPCTGIRLRESINYPSGFMHRNLDKLQPDRPLGSNGDFAFILTLSVMNYRELKIIPHIASGYNCDTT